VSRERDQTVFLSVQDVLAIHNNTLTNEGGARGVGDLGLLESAVAMPQQSFGGQMLHEDVLSQAAAYLLHIVNNHPFVDGNKRAGLQACQVFLRVNGYQQPSPRDAVALTMAVARRELGKDGLTQWFAENLGPLG